MAGDVVWTAKIKACDKVVVLLRHLQTWVDDRRDHDDDADREKHLWHLKTPLGVRDGEK